MEVFIDIHNVQRYMDDFCNIKSALDDLSNKLGKAIEESEASPTDRHLILKKQNIEDCQWDVLIDAVCVYQDITMFFERYEPDSEDIFLYKRLKKEFDSLPYIDANFSFIVPREEVEEPNGNN